MSTFQAEPTPDDMAQVGLVLERALLSDTMGEAFRAALQHEQDCLPFDTTLTPMARAGVSAALVMLISSANPLRCMRDLTAAAQLAVDETISAPGGAA